MVHSKKQIISVSYDIFSNENELNQVDQNILAQAKKAVNNAYAPYSNFHVGAAVLLEDGTIIQGNNQENAAYPSGLCAERVAMYYAGANYPNLKIKAIAITCKSESETINKPISPCGSCRQAMAEYETRHKQPIKVIMSGEIGEIFISESIQNLLPLMFSKEDLK